MSIQSKLHPFKLFRDAHAKIGRNVETLRLIELAFKTFLVLYSIWIAIAEFFDLSPEMSISSTRFVFAMIITLVVFSFLIGSPIFWRSKLDTMADLTSKAAWAICIGVALFACWQAEEMASPAKGFFDALAHAVTASIAVASAIELSKIFLTKRD
jgi:hypothetical protein